MTSNLYQSPLIEKLLKNRERRLHQLNKPMSLFSRSYLANLLLVVFCIADFVTVYSVWNMLLVESPLMLILIVVAFVIALDVTMSIAGNVLKQYHQGLRNKKDTMYIVVSCVSAFAVVYIFYLLLRISMKDILFADIGANTNLVDMTNQGAQQTEENSNQLVAWFATLALAVSPLATSLASFGVTYAVSDPVEENLHDIKKVKYKTEADIATIRSWLVQSGDVDTYIRTAYNREENLYNSFLNYIDATALSCQTSVSTMIMEKLGEKSADSITDLTDAGNKMLEEYEKLHPSYTSSCFIPGANTHVLDDSSDDKIIKAS